MRLPALSIEARLRSKCASAFRRHRKAAAKDMRTLDYTAADLIDLARRSQQCAYCRMPLSFAFEFDHMTPVARTPQAHRLANICCICPDCNRMKGGGMDAEEFCRLLALLRTFHPAALTDVRLRLIAGGRRYRGCGR